MGSHTGTQSCQKVFVFVFIVPSSPFAASPPVPIYWKFADSDSRRCVLA
jgi:hypothetical protein